MNTTPTPNKGEAPRKSRRVPFEKPISVEVQGFSEPVQLFSHDLSAGGIFLCTQNPLPVGTKVALQFGAPDLPVAVDEATVVWSTASEGIQDSTTLGMGVRFHHVSERNRMNLLLTVDQHMIKRGARDRDKAEKAQDITLPYSVPPEVFFERLDSSAPSMPVAGPVSWGELAQPEEPLGSIQPMGMAHSQTAREPALAYEDTLPPSLWRPSETPAAPGAQEEPVVIFDAMEEERVLEPAEAGAVLDAEDSLSWPWPEDAGAWPTDGGAGPESEGAGLVAAGEDAEPDLPIDVEPLEEQPIEVPGEFAMGALEIPPSGPEFGSAMTMPAAVDGPIEIELETATSPAEAILALDLEPPVLARRRGIRPHVWIGAAALALFCLTWAVVSFVQRVETSTAGAVAELGAPALVETAASRQVPPTPPPAVRTQPAALSASTAPIPASPQPEAKPAEAQRKGASSERAAGVGELTRPTFVESADGWQILLQSGQPLKAKVFKMDNPPRLVMDFAGVQYQGKTHQWKTPIPDVSRIRIAQQEGYTRVVVDMDGPSIRPFDSRSTPEGFVVTFRR